MTEGLYGCSGKGPDYMDPLRLAVLLRLAGPGFLGLPLGQASEHRTDPSYETQKITALGNGAILLLEPIQRICLRSGASV